MGMRVDVEGLAVRRGAFTLCVPRLSIEAGEAFAVLGATGSGKTVLMETIAGAFRDYEGRVLLDGIDARGIAVRDRGVGILYQDYALFNHMTVGDNVAYGLRRARAGADERRRRVAEMLEAFGIGNLADKMPGVISGGESQRVALARALVLRPRLLILDEPFSALDPATKTRMYGLLREVHRDFDCTILFVTHDFNEVRQLADRVGIVLGGRLRSVVQAEDLFDAEHDADVSSFLGMGGEKGDDDAVRGRCARG